MNIEIPHDPAIPFLGMYPRELNTGTQNSLPQVFIPAPFTMAEKVDTTQMLSAEGQTKCGRSHMVDYYYSIIKRNEVLIPATMRGTWKILGFGKRLDMKGHILYEMSRTGKSIQTESRFVAARAG